MSECRKLFRIETLPQGTNNGTQLVPFEHYCLRQQGHDGKCRSKFEPSYELRVEAPEEIVLALRARVAR